MESRNVDFLQLKRIIKLTELSN